MDQSSLMIVEDDPTVRSVVVTYLRTHGFTVTWHADGVSAREALRASVPDLVILDRMLPGINGDDLCREVRESSQVPIIMLTALGAVDDRIDGLEHGADDYLTKPFALRELFLRINALLRRTRQAPTTSEPFEVGIFRVDPTHRRIWLGIREITLTTREYELFLFLLQHHERVLSREEILREVWGWEFGDASTVTVHVRRLREKIEDDPRYPRFLLTEWGAGYRFAVEGDGNG